jgi:hypothetical protein
MSTMSQADAYTNLLQNIKQTIDPNRILSPGRYVPECDGKNLSARRATAAGAAQGSSVLR